MSLAERTGAVTAAAAAASFIGASVAAGSWVLLAVPCAAAVPWLLARRVRGAGGRRRLEGASLALLVCGCGVGLLAGLPPLLMLAAALAGTAAWDLVALAAASRGAADPASARRVEKAHLGRLALVLGAGALVGAAALLLRRPLGFAALLVAGALFALSFGAFLRLQGKGGA